MNKIDTTNKKRRSKYSPEFKDHVLGLAKENGVAQTARDLGVAESLIYSWRAKAQEFGDTLENQKIQSCELARLERENTRLQQENAFLKKAAAYFAKEQR